MKPALALIVLLPLAACKKDTQPNKPPVTAAVPRVDLTELGKKYENELVTGEADIARLVGDRSFLVGSGDDTALVVLEDPALDPNRVHLHPDQRLMLTGTVQPYSDWVDIDGPLEPETLDELKRHPRFLQVSWRGVEVVHDDTHVDGRKTREGLGDEVNDRKTR